MVEELTGFLEPVGRFVDPVFAPLTIFPPYIAILILSIILTAAIMGISRLFVNRNLMIQLKEQMENVKEKLNVAQKSGNKEEQTTQLNELMKINSQYMSHSMRIMMVSIVVAILFFPWLGFRYAGISAVELPFAIPIVGWETLDWLGWYIISAFTVGIVMRKIMGSDI
jgi:uncharacterized membrane protein (DUF106 family)